MRKYLIGSIAATTLVLSSCGGGGASGDQAKVADMMNDLAKESGIDLDSGCVEDAAAKLSDDDAKKLVEAGTDGDADISAEGEAIGAQMFEDCVDIGSYLSSTIDQLTEDGSVDAECLKKELGDIKTAAELDEKMFDAAFACSG